MYAFTRVPENWEFELAGYTNVSGGLKPDPAWVEADQKAAKYYAKTGLRSSETVRKDAARLSMAIQGTDRLIKVKPLLEDPLDTYPPAAGIQQWRVSDAAATRGTLRGLWLLTIAPDGRYPL